MSKEPAAKRCKKKHQRRRAEALLRGVDAKYFQFSSVCNRKKRILPYPVLLLAVIRSVEIRASRYPQAVAMGHPGKTAGLLFILVRMIAFQSAKPLIRQDDHQLFHSSVKILGSGDPHAFYLYGMSQDWDPAGSSYQRYSLRG